MTRRRGARLGFEFPRELLLAEIARRCGECGEPARLGLTKAEARAYQGFECETCESWNDDELAAPDIPDWWDELRRGPAGGAAGGLDSYAGAGGEDA